MSMCKNFWVLPWAEYTTSYLFELLITWNWSFGWQVAEVKGDDVVCVIKNSATLAGSLFTLHASQIRIDLPTLSETDKQVSGAINVMCKMCVFISCIVGEIFEWLIGEFGSI